MFKSADLVRKETESSQRKEYEREAIKLEKEIKDSINNGIMSASIIWEATIPPIQMIKELKELGYKVSWSENSKYLKISWKE